VLARGVYLVWHRSRCQIHPLGPALTDIRGEKFNQPLFGSNNIAGRVSMSTFNDQTGVADFMKWKLNFHGGGVGAFLVAFLNLMKDTRRQVAAVPMAEARLVLAEATIADAILHSPIHPSDPTAVWIDDAVLLDDDD